jgi:hypothetical protein
VLMLWEPPRDQVTPPEGAWSCLLVLVVTALVVATVVALWLAWTPTDW